MNHGFGLRSVVLIELSSCNEYKPPPQQHHPLRTVATNPYIHVSETLRPLSPPSLLAHSCPRPGNEYPTLLIFVHARNQTPDSIQIGGDLLATNTLPPHCYLLPGNECPTPPRAPPLQCLRTNAISGVTIVNPN